YTILLTISPIICNFGEILMRMKKILFSLISVMVFMPFLVSCDELGEISSEKDDTEQTEDENGNGGEENVPGGEDEPPYIILLTEIYPLASDAQVLTVMFETNVDWKVEVDSDIDWLSVSPSEGVAGLNEVTVQVSENEGYDERNAKVTVYYGDRQEAFVIYQNQKNAMILSESRSRCRSKEVHLRSRSMRM
ncbi:MAG: BACON domain-containing protein, partial [Lachnospiraceae bacterium]|nr:BACON domain-containing protein [Lachnospiraceae bacterium]